MDAPLTRNSFHTRRLGRYDWRKGTVGILGAELHQSLVIDVSILTTGRVALVA